MSKSLNVDGVVIGRVWINYRNANYDREDANLTAIERLGAGAVAGIFAMSATYPLDMVRIFRGPGHILCN